MERADRPWQALEVSSGDRQAAETSGQESGAAPGWPLLLGIAAAAVLGVGAFLLASSAPSGEIRVEARSAVSTGSAVPGGAAGSGEPAGDVLIVEVDGAVVQPGIVRLAPGSRIADAIEAAGGFGPRVDVTRADRELNLAAVVEDGQQVHVPSRDEPPPPVSTAAAPATAGQSGPIDLNSASAEQLESLPGIGPATAAKIIAGREERRYATVDELRERKIVGQATFEKIRDLVVAG